LASISLLRNFLRNSLSIMSGLSNATTSTTSCNNTTQSRYLSESYAASHVNCIVFGCSCSNCQLNVNPLTLLATLPLQSLYMYM
jgi:hypothetical protein